MSGVVFTSATGQPSGALSSGADTFTGSAAVGSLSGPGYLRYTRGFDRLVAYATAGGINRRSVSSLTYTVSFVGAWL